MRSLLAFFALAVSACVSALVFPVKLCVAEYCAGNFPDGVQRSAPTPSVPSPLDALTYANRPLKAPVRRRSGAYPLLLDDKSVRLAVLFQILSADQRLPLSRHSSRNDRNQTRSCRGQKQRRRQSWLYFQEFPQQSPAPI